MSHFPVQIFVWTAACGYNTDMTGSRTCSCWCTGAILGGGLESWPGWPGTCCVVKVTTVCCGTPLGSMLGGCRLRTSPGGSPCSVPPVPVPTTQATDVMGDWMMVPPTAACWNSCGGRPDIGTWLDTGSVVYVVTGIKHAYNNGKVTGASQIHYYNYSKLIHKRHQMV